MVAEHEKRAATVEKKKKRDAEAEQKRLRKDEREDAEAVKGLQPQLGDQNCKCV